MFTRAVIMWQPVPNSVSTGTLWVAYGLAVKDIFVWALNAVGVVLGLVQLLLYVIFRQQKQR